MDPVASAIVALLNETVESPPWWGSAPEDRDGVVPDWADDVVSSIASFVEKVDQIQWIGGGFQIHGSADDEATETFVAVLTNLIVVARVFPHPESEDQLFVGTRAFPFRAIKSFVVRNVGGRYRLTRELDPEQTMAASFEVDGGLEDVRISTWAGTPDRQEKLLGVLRKIASQL